MYQNIYVKRTKTSNEIHLWDDKTGYSKFQYKPYAYLKSQTGTYRSLYGDKLKKVNFWTGDDIKNGRVLGELFVKGHDKSVNELLKENGHAYEYDGGKKKVFGS